MMLEISFLEVRWAMRFAVDDSDCRAGSTFVVAHGDASDLYP